MIETLPKLAVLVSGQGTNLQSIMDHIQSGKLKAQISVVISNEPHAFALQRAQNAGIATAVVSHKSFPDRKSFDQAILQLLVKHDVSLVILAGFMRILGGDFIANFPKRILNIHPSLLPKYPGMNAIQKAFEQKEKETGVTVHFVNEDMDGGEVILQEKISILPQDTLTSLESRIHSLEHQIYPKAIQKVLKGM